MKRFISANADKLFAYQIFTLSLCYRSQFYQLTIMNKQIKGHKQSVPIVAFKSDSYRKASQQKANTIEHLPAQARQQRLYTQPLKEDEHWQFIESRRENHLNSLFYRRKTILEAISRKNREIYQRILKQQSQYQKQKLLPKAQKQKVSLLETLTNGSRMLLTMSRQAMIQSKMQSESIYNELDKENIVIESIASKRLSASKQTQLAVIRQEGNGKVIESRLIPHLTSRHQPSQEQTGSIRPRGGSVGRRRLNDIVLNF